MSDLFLGFRVLGARVSNGVSRSLKRVFGGFGWFGGFGSRARAWVTGDGAPRSTSEIASQLESDAGSALWTVL